MEIGKLIKVKVGDIKAPECIVWTTDNLDMVDEIIKNYDVNISDIKISKDFKLIDGGHRLCILWEEYGDKHEIMVRQVPISQWLFYTILFTFLPILFPVGIVLRVLKQKKNKKNGIK
jgi:hypothetical protein